MGMGNQRDAGIWLVNLRQLFHNFLPNLASVNEIRHVLRAQAKALILPRSFLSLSPGNRRPAGDSE